MTSAVNSLVAQGLALLHEKAGVTVAYSDGTNGDIVNAIPCQPVDRDDGELATQTTDRRRDWKINVSELEAISPAVTLPPAAGHTITLNGDTYEVVAGDDGPAWEYVDTGETDYRIRTIKTGGA
ncbi:MAG: hypothetical protein AAGC72_01115 [Planctomycetota bacterium]